MQRFLKENHILLIGILLPIVLIIGFYLASVLPKMLVTPPKIDLLYLTTTYPHDGITTEIKDGTLKIWISPLVRKGTLPMPRLFHFNAKTKTSTEIPISFALTAAPKITNENKDKKEELNIPEIQNLKLDPEIISKDGYKAEISAPNVGGVANLLILNPKRTLIISKSGNIVNISDKNQDIENQKFIKFLGWIREK